MRTSLSLRRVVCVLASAWSLALGACGGGGGGGSAPPRPDTTAPTVPAGVDATAITSRLVHISWLSSTDDVGVAAYRVHRDGAIWVEAGAAVPTGCDDATVEPGASHCYAVSARDAAGNESAPSPPACATTPGGADTEPPADPTGLVATVAARSRVDLSWSGPPDAVLYRLLRDGAPILETPDLAASDPAPLPRTRHCYRVVALDGAANASGESAEACVDTWWISELAVPSAVSDCALEVDALGTVHVAFWSGLLGHGVRTGAGWGVDFQVGWSNLADAAGGFDLALDGQGRPHLVWWLRPGGGSSGTLQHSVRDAGSWVTGLVDAQAASASTGVALAFDAGGALHAGYQKGGRPWHAARGGGGAWTPDPESADTRSVVYWPTALAVDGQGRMALAYQVQPVAYDSGLRLARLEAGVWRQEWIDYGALLDRTIMRSAGGALHVFSRGRYDTDASGSWVGRGGPPAIGRFGFAVDGLGRPHVSYQLDGGVHHAWLDGAVWRDEVVDRSGTCGTLDDALAVDAAGGVHVCYDCDDGTGRTLRYARAP